MGKFLSSLWRILVSASLYGLIILLIIPFIHPLTDQQEFLMQILEYSATLILVIDFLYHLNKAKDKKEFIKKEWLSLLLLFPLFSIFRILRFFRFTEFLRGIPEVAKIGGKSDELLDVILGRLDSLEQFQHLSHFLHEKKENIKKYLNKK